MLLCRAMHSAASFFSAWQLSPQRRKQGRIPGGYRIGGRGRCGETTKKFNNKNCPPAWGTPSRRAIFVVELLCRFTASSPSSYTVAAWYTALLPSLWRQLPSTKKRSCGVHRSAQEHGARPLRRFVSVGRVNRSAHIFGNLK